MDFEDIFQLTDDGLQESFDKAVPIDTSSLSTPPHRWRAGPARQASETALKAGHATDGAMREYASELGLDVNLEPGRFRDHVARVVRAKPGEAYPRDWMTAYQGWCRKAVAIHRQRKDKGWEENENERTTVG
jgi:hypothetical protein